MSNPFTEPRPAHQTPYWLRNGIADAAEVETLMAEHRRRLGMHHTLTALAEERAVVDRLIDDIALGKINATKAMVELNAWRVRRDAT